MDHLIIQVEEKQITVARFSLSAKSGRLLGAAQFPLGEEQDLQAVVRQVADGIDGQVKVVFCLPPQLFAQRIVELPLNDLRKVREVLPVQLQGEIVLPVEEAIFDALPSYGARFLALWARKADIAHAIATFREAGQDPQQVSSAPFAWNFLPGITTDCALCDGSALVIIAQGKPAFFRPLNGDPARQLVATLSTLELAGVALPPQLFVFGPQAEALAAAEDLPLAAEILELPAEQATIFRTMDNFQQLASLFAVARASRAGALPDFRRGDLAYTAGDAKIRKKLILTGILAGLVVLLLFVSKGLQYRTVSKDLVSLNNSIAAIYREIFPNRPKAVDEVAEIKGEIRKLTGVDNGSGVLGILKQLAEAKGSINGLYEAEIEGSNLRLKGDAPSNQAINDFKAKLASLMATVEVGEVKTKPDGSVSFALTGTIKEVKK